jgi:hypothetical protein
MEVLQTKEISAVGQDAKPDKTSAEGQGNKLWVDPDTQLTWTTRPVNTSINGISHSDAVATCKELTLGDWSDWRLPTENELKTLIKGVVRKSVTQIVIKDSIVLEGPVAALWGSEEKAGLFANNARNYITLDFMWGPPEIGFQSDIPFVYCICVRSPQKN